MAGDIVKLDFLQTIVGVSWGGKYKLEAGVEISANDGFLLSSSATFKVAGFIFPLTFTNAGSFVTYIYRSDDFAAALRERNITPRAGLLLTMEASGFSEDPLHRPIDTFLDNMGFDLTNLKTGAVQDKSSPRQINSGSYIASLDALKWLLT